MKDDRIYNIITESIRKAVSTQKQRQLIENIVEKTLNKHISLLKEDEEASDAAQKRQRVVSVVKNDLVKYSTLAYRLWPDMDKDTARSLFSKKLNGKPDADGQVREFTEAEVNTLDDLLKAEM